MSTGIICHYGKTANTLQASARIARLLSARYGFPIVDSVDTARQYAGTAYDYCIVVSSASGFAPPELREAVGEFAALAHRFVFVQNDFMTEPAGQIGTWHRKLGKEYRRTVWSTIPHRLRAERATTESSYINFNMLTYDPSVPPAQEYESPQTLFYYGAHRRERVPYFQRWLNTDEYPQVVSTSTRVYKKWQASCPKANLVPQMEDATRQMRELGNVGLYLEDAHSHKVYTSPANRFYEMLSARVPMLFDRSTLNTFQQAGYNTEPFMLYAPRLDGSNLKELVLAATESAPALADHQQTLWARDYRAELEEQIQTAERKIGLHPVRTQHDATFERTLVEHPVITEELRKAEGT